MTAQQAIETSVNETRTVALYDATDDDVSTLLAECDDNDGGDYWGVDESGNAWRIRVNA